MVDSRRCPFNLLELDRGAKPAQNRRFASVGEFGYESDLASVQKGQDTFRPIGIDQAGTDAGRFAK
jgi:hypothetical protein